MISITILPVGRNGALPVSTGTSLVYLLISLKLIDLTPDFELFDSLDSSSTEQDNNKKESGGKESNNDTNGDNDVCEDVTKYKSRCGIWKSQGFCAHSKMRDSLCKNTCGTCAGQFSLVCLVCLSTLIVLFQKLTARICHGKIIF